MRWLGLVLMTTVGGAWALNPVVDRPVDTKIVEKSLKSPVFEGEPQVVSQLMGATVGAADTPTRSLRPVGTKLQRVVVAAIDAEEPRNSAEFVRAVEQLESEYATSGSYPALPASSVSLEGVGYQVEQGRFKLTGESLTYDSDLGFQGSPDTSKETPARGYRVVGYLNEVVEGWGPWKTPACEFSSSDPKLAEEFAWLSEAADTPDWSARVYFPISQEQTGYAFRRTDGSCAYSSGELLFDGVNGTFRLKLNRTDKAEEAALSPASLESRLEADDSACSLVGEGKLLRDLGFLATAEKADGVVQVSNPTRLRISGQTALDGLVMAAFSRHARSLAGAEFAAKAGDDTKATLVGRLELTDRLGQVHSVRVRAGRAESYDWVVGQLCDLKQKADGVYESKAYDDSYRNDGARTITAGK